MAFNGRDLFHRRPTAPTTSLRRTSDITSSRQRRKRRSRDDRNKNVLFAFSAVFIVFILALLVFSKRKGGEKDSKSNIEQWKPRLKNSATVMHNNDEKASRSAFKRNNAPKAQVDSGELYRNKFTTSELGYDIFNCPSVPPDGYPRSWPITDIISNWNPNEATTISPNYRHVHHSLCIFDYQTQYEIALAYRDAEKPFIIRNDPRVTAVSKKWSEPQYLLDHLPEKKMYTERSSINHFMFYNNNKRKTIKDWVKPLNDIISMRYDEWLERSLERDAIALSDANLIKRVNQMKEIRLEREKTDIGNEVEEEADDEIEEDRDHEGQKHLNWYYWRLNAFIEDEDETSQMVFNDMPFFDPRKEEESKFYLVDPSDQRGINCRFGMRGIIAESHCDLSRNMITLLHGERRYIIGHPNQCENLYLYPKGHPSGRHASFDWSNPTNWDLHPKFYDALHTEVIMTAGDTLYLPTAWFHHIVNLSNNIQCNIRSGISDENSEVLKECGFKLPPHKQM